MRVRITCFVQEGDLPLTLAWEKDQSRIHPNEDIKMDKLDDYTSMLVIDRIQEHHSGNYTCVATNAARVAKSTAFLSVSGK